MDWVEKNKIIFYCAHWHCTGREKMANFPNGKLINTIHSGKCEKRGALDQRAAEWLDTTVIRPNWIRFFSRIFHSIREALLWTLSLWLPLKWIFKCIFRPRPLFPGKKLCWHFPCERQKKEWNVFCFVCDAPQAASLIVETFLLRAKFIKSQISIEKSTVERTIYPRSLTAEHNLMSDTNRASEQC